MSTSLTAAEAGEYARIREAAASWRLDDVALLELAGEDRLSWLQGQATNDVRGLTPGASLSFCLCEATGQILAPVDAWALEDRILLAVPTERVGAVLARVERMTIMEDVEARDLSSERYGVTVQGPGAAGGLAGLLPASAVSLRSDRSGSGGWDVWLSRDSVEWAESISGRFAPVGGGAVEAARIEAGLPKWGVDMGPRTLPAEMGPAFESRHVSYQKGCYTGQEVLMRMHSRGHTNRTWVGLVSESPLAIGAPVLFQDGEVGKVASAAPSPRFGWVAAATLRNEAVGESASVRVGEAEAQVRSMPFLRSL